MSENKPVPATPHEQEQAAIAADNAARLDRHDKQQAQIAKDNREERDQMQKQHTDQLAQRQIHKAQDVRAMSVQTAHRRLTQEKEADARRSGHEHVPDAPTVTEILDDAEKLQRFIESGERIDK